MPESLAEVSRRALASWAWLDALPAGEARAALLRCCGSARWVDGMLARRPFGSDAGLAVAARDVWALLGREDWLEAFSHHPAIGGDLAALQARFAPTRAWSSAEQAGVASADQATLVALAAGNRSYRERFGYTFIICASGKSASEMLLALEERLEHNADTELRVAAAEHEQITGLRLQKLGLETGTTSNQP
jgi:2-oxo-4-hydroxy-4-carboxy-5-ureidoimidazoline decarboxylase